MAFGSTHELQTQLQLLIDLNFISETKILPLKELLTEIQKMIYSLKTSLKL
ncbi:four helix bundle protein [Chryseobacterium sp.]|uniref:four helix bundle protein n=1 Tax=Chryseobacterium sp. TaxID=1871047 RepID=UPI002FC80299